MRSDTAARDVALYHEPSDTYQSLMAASPGGELWHCKFGISTSVGNTTNWAGRLAATSVPAPAAGQRPPYSVDGSFFAGTSVVQSVALGSKCLRGTGLSGLPLTGTRPYIFECVRFRNAPAGGTFPVSLTLGTAAGGEVAQQQSNSAVKFVNYYNGVAVQGPANDTAVHFLETWADGTNVYFVVDGVVYSTASAVTTANTCTVVGIGIGAGSANDGILHSDCSHAVKGWCPSVLPPANRAGLRALVRAEFQF